MALLTAYLARTAQGSAGRAITMAARTLFDRVTTFVRAVSIALSEAQEMRRVMTQRYPFIDI